MADDLWVLEGAQNAREGEIKIYSIVWAGFASVSSGATAAYRNGNDVSSSCLTGSEGISGNVQTLRTFTIPSGWGGSNVVLEAQVDAPGGQRLKRGIMVHVLKPGEEL